MIKLLISACNTYRHVSCK